MFIRWGDRINLGGCIGLTTVSSVAVPFSSLPARDMAAKRPASAHYRDGTRPAPLEAGSAGNFPFVGAIVGSGRRSTTESEAMAQAILLKATARDRAGKGAARQARREGKIPAVIYGAGRSPAVIDLDYNEVWKQYIKGSFTSSIVNVDVNGQTNMVIPRDVQLDPIIDRPLHVDFQRVGEDGRIRVAVAVKFTNELLSPGLKRGGILNVVRHEIEVTCPYEKIPPFFEIDLTGIEIGRSIHVSALKLPDDIKPVIQNRDFTIATIAGVAKDEAAAAAAAAAPAAAAKAPAGKAPAKAAPAAKAGAPAAKAAAPAAKKK